MNQHDHLTTKLTVLRDQIDRLTDEAGRREPTIRAALALFREREIARRI